MTTIINIKRGTIERLMPNFGFIRGEDGVSFFFLPSAISPLSAVEWPAVAQGMNAEFIPIEHPRGPRAIGVTIHSCPIDLSDGDEMEG